MIEGIFPKQMINKKIKNETDELKNGKRKLKEKVQNMEQSMPI